MTRAKLEALAWRHTHRDFKGHGADGSREVLRMVPGVGTCQVPLASLTEAELWAKVPRTIRESIAEVAQSAGELAARGE